MSRRAVNLGLVPFGALAMSAVFGALSLLAPNSLLFLTSLAALGVAGGLYLVPLGPSSWIARKKATRPILAASTRSPASQASWPWVCIG